MATNIFLKFQYLDPKTNTWKNYPANLDVAAIDWDSFLNHDHLASGQTNRSGVVHLEVSDNAIAGADRDGKPDIFFTIKPNGLVRDGVPLPKFWSSQFAVDKDGRPGWYVGFNGGDIGTRDNPITFRIKGVIAYLEVHYYNQSKDRILPCPEGVAVQMWDYDPRTPDELLAATTTDANGKAALVYHPGSVQQESQERNPDIYFRFDPMGIRDDGDPLPMVQSSRGMRSDYGGTGYYPESSDDSLGQFDSPRRYVLGPKHFIRVGFIAVTESDRDISSQSFKDNVAKVRVIQEKFKEQYAYATWGRSLVVGRQEVGVVKLPGKYPTDRQEMADALKFIARKWYETHGDLYDYLAIYPEKRNHHLEGEHIDVQGRVENIGQRVFDSSREYGSRGALLGLGLVANMEGLPEDYHFINSEVDLALHEIVAHQYGMSGLQDFGISNRVHFEHETSGPAWSVLYARPWRMTRDGKYYNENPTAAQKRDGFFVRFHPITMYAMGLFSPSEVPPTMVITPAEGEDTGRKYSGPPRSRAIAATPNYYTIQQIIRKWGGPRREV